MSADGTFEGVWAGDERRFRLGIKELIALQERRQSGPMEIVRRLQFGTWRVEDVTETIRIGLIGDGVDGKAARALVEENIAPPNIVVHVMTALAILLCALQGDPDDPVGKAPAVADAPEASASPPPPSTETVQ
jgi:hypothetical protein